MVNNTIIMQIRGNVCIFERNVIMAQFICFTTTQAKHFLFGLIVASIDGT